MPQPFFNPSSSLAKRENDKYQKNNADSIEIHKDDKINTACSSAADDWHYCTEELLDALPRPWTRSLLYLILGFSAIALRWSIVAQVDETGSARGRIEPKGATQQLDSPASGSVSVVRVKEGETVRAGQILVELESDVMKTELQQAQTKLEGLRFQQANLDLLKNQLGLALQTQEQQNQAQELAKLAQVEQAEQNLNTLKTTYNLQKEEKEAQVSQIRQAIKSSQASLNLAKVRLEAAKEKVPRYKMAYEEGVIPQDRFQETQQVEKESYQRVVQAQSELSQAESSLQEQQTSYEKTIHQAKSDIQQAQLRLQEQQRTYQSLIHTGKLAELKTQEQLKELETQIGKLRLEIAQTKNQIASLRIQLRQRVVRSPISGVIFELPITKPGAFVQPGEKIVKIAPANTALVLKASMPSQESGFMKVGMPVKVKFDAYPFQEYGIVQGKVTWISPDSKVSETPQGKIEVYELEITLNQPYIQNGDKRIALTPGQTATAEVIVRQRRVIDYLLDPFKKLQKSGLDL